MEASTNLNMGVMGDVVKHGFCHFPGKWESKSKR